MCAFLLNIQETIPLRGEVYFPSAKADKKVIDFGVVTNGTEAVDDFSITNNDNFCLTYKWYIKPKSTVIKPPGCARAVSFSFYANIVCMKNLKKQCYLLFQVEAPRYNEVKSDTDLFSEYDDFEDDISERSTQSMYA